MPAAPRSTLQIGAPSLQKRASSPQARGSWDSSLLFLEWGLSQVRIDCLRYMHSAFCAPRNPLLTPLREQVGSLDLIARKFHGHRTIVWWKRNGGKP